MKRSKLVFRVLEERRALAPFFSRCSAYHFFLYASERIEDDKGKESVLLRVAKFIGRYHNTYNVRLAW